MVALSGGGFRAMTGSMVIARALATAPGGSLWPQVTTLASNSGGSWFTSMFINDAAFQGTILDGATPLSSVVATWGTNYSHSLATHQQGIPAWVPITDKEICKAFDSTVQGVASTAFSLQTVPKYWQPYVAAVLDATSPELVERLGAGAVRPGQIAATLVQVMSLPPDAYVLSSSGVRGAESLMVDGHTVDYAVPLGFAIDADGSAMWMHNAQVQLTLADGTSVHPAPLQTNLTIGTLSAASSAALGFASSPAMIGQVIPSWLSWLIASCTETLGLDGAAIPTDGAPLGVAVFPPSYRFIDGAYTDNSGAAMGLAALLGECAGGAASSAAPCYPTPRLIIVDHDAASGNAGTSRKLFRAPAGTATSSLPCATSLPSSPCTDGGGAITHWSAAQSGQLAPLATIFDADYPAASTFVPYSSASSDYWSGELTTAANSWYGVPAGQRVHVLLIRLKTSQPEVPPLTYQLTTPSRVQAFAQLFTNTYAGGVDAQVSLLGPVLQAFLRG